MSARDAILSSVRSAKPASIPLPDLPLALSKFSRSDERLITRMVRVASVGGIDVVLGARVALTRIVAESYPDAERVLSALPEVPGNITFANDPHTLENVDVYVCEGVLGVAEDGSVWLPADRLGQRAALFLAAHVVIVLDETTIVENLHDAYAKIDIAANEFGVFVAGPSKTADIEQSLVIGAHGPKSVTLILVR